MDKDKTKKEFERLSLEIEEHNYRYYALGDPIISDTEYDRLMHRLINLEEQFPELSDSNSPTKRIGVKLLQSAKAIAHSSKMYSLDNTYSVEELKKWDERVRKGLPNQKIEYVVELKIDGVSAALIYRNGKFSFGATRGDGITGEDITHNLKTVRSIPLKLKSEKDNDIPDIFEVRAEIYMRIDDFINLNKDRKKKNETLFANPRNATSGSVKLLDSRITAERRLNCFVHSFGVLQGGKAPDTQWEFLQAAKRYNLHVNSEIRLCKTFKDVLEYCKEYENKRASIPYEVDGVVIKVNSLKQQRDLGATLKSPRWAVAYKFPAHQATAHIKDIVVQIGRTGTLTPVAELEPVACAGVIISRATLHNFDEIRRLGVKKGDRVLLERAGDVIPKIIKVVQSDKGKKVSVFSIPKKCPECKGEISKVKEEDVAYRCTNPSCPKQLERRVIHFCSRGAMDIEGLGESVVVQLLQKEKIKDFADIYFLKKDDLLKLDLFAEKKADNLLKAIKNSKGQSLSRFLYALGILNIGEKAAYTLAKRFRNLDTIMSTSANEFKQMRDIGSVMAVSIEHFFRQPSTKRLIKKFKKAGVNMAESVGLITNGKLAGKKFVLTGELENFTRYDASELIKKLGGEVTSSVSKNTDFVIAGDNSGSKYTKAKNIGIKVINEKQFKEMVNA